MITKLLLIQSLLQQCDNQELALMIIIIMLVLSH